MTMPRRRAARASLFLTAVAAAAGLVVVVGSTLAAAGDQGPPGQQTVTSLKEASLEPQGLAAGDSVLQAPAPVPVATVEPEAEGVDDGTQAQADAVVMDDLGSRTAERRRAAEALPPSALTAGCLPGYGRDGQCLPPVSPAQQGHDAAMGSMPGMVLPWTCAQVRTLFPVGVPVSDDSLGLDTDGDGTACDVDDVA